jgi:hypothetical protein
VRKVKNTFKDLRTGGITKLIKNNIGLATKQLQERVFAPKIRIAQPPNMKVPQSHTVPKLSKCALKYALACAEPFHELSYGACIPSGEVPSSQKAHALNHFDGAIGTAGIGWIIVTPSLGNDAVNAFFTTSSYTGTVASPLSANNTLNVGVQTATPSNLPYSSAQLFTSTTIAEPFVSGKIVSLGLRVNYTGTTLNESGMRYCYVDPTHFSVSGMGTAALGTMAQADIRMFTRANCEASVSAINADELIMSDEADITSGTGTGVLYPYSGGLIAFQTTYQGATSFSYANTGTTATNVGSPVLVVLVTGVSGMSFHVDLVTHAEFAGINTQSMVEPNPADTEGSHIVMNAAGKLLQNKMSSNKSTGWAAMHQELSNAAMELVKVAVPSSLSALYNIL